MEIQTATKQQQKIFASILRINKELRKENEELKQENEKIKLRLRQRL